MNEIAVIPGLNERQTKFLYHFTEDSVSVGQGRESALRAGYGVKSAYEAARYLLGLPKMQAAIHAAVGRLISGPMVVKAAALLDYVVSSPTAPLKLRVDCAKTILDRGGFIPPKARELVESEGKSPEDMSKEERTERLAALARERERFEHVQAERAMPVMELAADNAADSGADGPQAIDILE